MERPSEAGSGLGWALEAWLEVNEASWSPRARSTQALGLLARSSEAGGGEEGLLAMRDLAQEGLPRQDLAEAQRDPGKGVGDGWIRASSGRGGVDPLV